MPSFILTNSGSVSGNVVVDKGVSVEDGSPATVNAITNEILAAVAAGLITITYPTAPDNIVISGDELAEESAFSGTASVTDEIVGTASWSDVDDNDATLMAQINECRSNVSNLSCLIEGLINHQIR